MLRQCQLDFQTLGDSFRKLSSKSTAASRCLEFVCFVKPPFDLQTLVQLGQGNDFLPSISVRASRNSVSTSSVSVSKISSDRFRLKSVKLSPCDSLWVSKSTHIRLLHVQELSRTTPISMPFSPSILSIFSCFCQNKEKMFSSFKHVSYFTPMCFINTLAA